MTFKFDDLFIFEMANNHQGSVGHGIKIIKKMAKIAREFDIRAAVKLQYRDLGTFIHPDYRDRKDVKHIPRFLSTRLDNSQFYSLIKTIRDEGLISIVTPFDEVSVWKCLDHGVEIIKVASCSATDWPLLEEVSNTKKPVIISTGGLKIHDIDNIVSFFTHKKVNFALMHCVAQYPTTSSDACMNFISRLKVRYPQVSIGYSGHEEPDNNDIAKAAIAKGVCIVERHVGIATKTIALNKYSMNPEQVQQWVESILTMKQICGAPSEKKIAQVEIESLLSLKRGVYASKNLKTGDTFTNDDVYFAMPCHQGQLSSGDFGKKRAVFHASKEYKKNEPIYESNKLDTIDLVRGVIHDAKGMIYEARLEFGDDYDVELSHHYGIKHFRQTGALIVNVINREYCKKIIAVLPSQKHPKHHHRIKEETFQLLWGDLEVELNGILINMKPGDKLLVERGAWHSFTTHDGAVFEEISTTHHKNDSYYDDNSISKLDPMERKTILQDW